MTGEFEVLLRCASWTHSNAPCITVLLATVRIRIVSRLDTLCACLLAAGVYLK
jgi:hypothetical protein